VKTACHNPEVFCQFLNNRLEFWREIYRLITYSYAHTSAKLHFSLSLTVEWPRIHFSRSLNDCRMKDASLFALKRRKKQCHWNNIISNSPNPNCQLPAFMRAVSHGFACDSTVFFNLLVRIGLVDRSPEGLSHQITRNACYSATV